MKKRIYTQLLYVTDTHKSPVTFIKSISCKIQSYLLSNLVLSVLTF